METKQIKVVVRIEEAWQAAVTNSRGKGQGMGRGRSSQGPRESTAPKPDLVDSMEASDGVGGMVVHPVLVGRGRGKGQDRR